MLSSPFGSSKYVYCDQGTGILLALPKYQLPPFSITPVSPTIPGEEVELTSLVLCVIDTIIVRSSVLHCTNYADLYYTREYITPNTFLHKTIQDYTLLQ